MFHVAETRGRVRKQATGQTSARCDEQFWRSIRAWESQLNPERVDANIDSPSRLALERWPRLCRRCGVLQRWSAGRSMPSRLTTALVGGSLSNDIFRNG